MNAIDRAALAAAHALVARQPQAKFVSNIISGAAQYVVPALALAATFATGGAAAPLAFASHLAGGIATANGLLGGGGDGQQGGGGLGGGGNNPLATIINGVGPAVATNALAQQYWSKALQARDDSAARITGATGSTIDDYMKRAQGMTNPALTGHYGPALVNSPERVSAQQMTGNAAGPSVGAAPTFSPGPSGLDINHLLQAALQYVPGQNTNGGFRPTTNQGPPPSGQVATTFGDGRANTPAQTPGYPLPSMRRVM